MPGRPEEHGPPTDEHYHREVYDDWAQGYAPPEELHGTGLDLGLLLLRLALLLLLPRGLVKAADMAGFVRQVESNVVGAQAPELFAWVVMVGQVSLPVLVAVGLFARPAAFLLAGMMAAIWILETYLRPGYAPLTADGALAGEPALLYLALALPLAFTGAGRWSLDSMRTGGRP